MPDDENTYVKISCKVFLNDIGMANYFPEYRPKSAYLFLVGKRANFIAVDLWQPDFKSNPSIPVYRRIRICSISSMTSQ